VASRLDAAGDLPDISNSLLCRRKKVEYRTVMPEVIRVWFQINVRDIADNPMDLRRGRTQPALCEVNCGLRDIEDSDVFVPAKKQIVNKR